MKRQEILQKIAKAAKAKGTTWDFHRQGSRHEIWKCGSTTVLIPRHTEVKPNLTLGIFRRLNRELGKDWWK